MVLAMVLAVFVAVVLWLWPSPAMAALKCQTVGEHRVCLESAKRSAKYFWQYRVVASVDGVSLPLRLYDCRARDAADTEVPSGTARAGSDPDSPLTVDDPVDGLAAADFQAWVCRAVQPRP